MINTGYLTASNSTNSNECLTPRYAVEPIIKYLENKSYRKVWCPFDHKHSQYVRILRKEGFEIVYSHIENGKDFFRYEPRCYDVIVCSRARIA